MLSCHLCLRRLVPRSDLRNSLTIELGKNPGRCVRQRALMFVPRRFLFILLLNSRLPLIHALTWSVFENFKFLTSLSNASYGSCLAAFQQIDLSISNSQASRSPTRLSLLQRHDVELSEGRLHQHLSKPRHVRHENGPSHCRVGDRWDPYRSRAILSR